MAGHIRKRYKSSWVVTVDLGRDPITGKRIRKQRSVKGTRRDAEKVLRQLEYEADTGRLAMAPDTLTLAGYLESWLKEIRTRTRTRTHEEYQAQLENRVIPALGQVRLSQLRPQHLQQLYSNIMSGPRLDGKPGNPGPRTVQLIHRILHKALADALRLRLISVNPADAVVPPRPEKREMDTLTAEETARLLDAAAGQPYEAAFYLALFTGMRQGEILGLRWRDVDWENSVLMVRQVVARTRGGLKIEAPKTEKSRRSIPVGGVVLSALRRQRARQAEERLAAGENWVDNDLVFPGRNGNPMHPSVLYRRFQQILKAAGLPHIRFHDSRHTHATLLLQQGVHPKIVQERLGHASITLTMDTYSHVIPSLQREAAAALESNVGRRLGGDQRKTAHSDET